MWSESLNDALAQAEAAVNADLDVVKARLAIEW